MSEGPRPLSALTRQIALQPMDGARAVLALGLPAGALWSAFWLFAILSAILIFLQVSLLIAATGPAGLPVEILQTLEAARGSPFRLAAGQALFFLIAVQALHRIGRAMGGTGDYPGALAVIVLAQAGMVALIAAQLLAMLLLPPIAAIFGLGFLVFLFWHLPSFVMALHGFANRIAVVAMIVVVFVAIQVLLAMLNAILGVAAGGGPGHV